MKITHKKLELIGASWLTETGRLWTCKRVAIEPNGLGPEKPDVIGYSFGSVHVIECKTSRADFLRDSHKVWRDTVPPMGSHRWWLCPEGLIELSDILPEEGLLWLDESGKITVVRKAESRDDASRNYPGELAILYGMINKAEQRSVTIYGYAL